ncbi:kinesin light chain, putative [Perkinsus marinus ATCC 50983]|uniref:Kinesin light chain, putative n=1 Tax=Perkinsus marinus (strain ATCC 50983 / TXsc) TaxID=423536 RepID=C5LT17_PERM5|nr:kinesin light chain, putative [Perkinsus marinus ATCC 50983]EEQ99984.1 kinesin light chain, putative [Perkinsus marinus ATCC 50983]|eukprot:XP_002767267.1 kinesin light chain, putative [Perkinsus marinus ATCC 50983]
MSSSSTEDLYSQALTCINNNNYSEAEIILDRILQRVEEEFGPDHADTAQCLMMFGMVLQKGGKLAEAETKLRRCLEIRRELFGEDSSVFGITLNVLASVVTAQGGDKLPEAARLCEECVDHAERILGHVHANTANAYLQLGYTQVQAGKFGEAEEALRECVEIRTRVFGRNHPETIKALGMYVEVLRKLSRFEEAHELEK